MEGFTFEPIDDEFTEEIKKNSNLKKFSNPDVVVHPSECVLPRVFEKYFERIYNFEVFPDDVWIVSYPKSGTTWTQEMVWLLRNNLDYETAKSVNLRFRCPFLELKAIIETVKDSDDIPDTIELAAKTQRPRCIKSHLPLELLPKALWTVKPKIVYVTRNPRDVAISYYHHYRLWNGYQGTLEDFTCVFLDDKIVYSPFWRHILGFWDLEDKSHVLINNYEGMKRDLASVIRNTAKFLEVEISEKDVEKLQEHLSFKNMKDNNSVNYLDLVIEAKKESGTDDDELVFMRRGECGDWMDLYPEELIERFGEWTAEKLVDTPYIEYPHAS